MITTWLLLGPLLALQGADPPLTGRRDRSVHHPAIFGQVDLFRAGELGVHTYRIPALVTTTSGTLVAVCDARHDDSSDLPGNIDLVMRRSTDRGRTWSPIESIQDLPEDHGAGDPSLIVDRVTGRIFCFYAYGPPGIGFPNSQAGSNETDDPDTLHAYVITSDDEGLTWSAASDLNPQIKRPAWQALFASSGHGIQTSTGRLLQPYVVRNGNGVVSARNAYSDDHGSTWQMGPAIATNVNESKLLERIDGAVLQNMRHNSVKSRFGAVSLDGGKSFGTVTRDDELIDPNVNASFTRLASTQDGGLRNLVLFTNPANTAARTNLTVRLSGDEGQSWPHARVVHNGPAAYSSLTVLSDGTIGLLYERGDVSSVEKITFARFSLEWILERVPLLTASGAPDPRHPDLWTWLDAGDAASVNGEGADADGDAVTLWNDVSNGSFHDLARSSDGTPTQRRSVIAGRPALEFAGDTDLWGAAGAGGELQTIPNGFTVLILARVRALDGTGYVFDRTTGAGGVGLRVVAGDPDRFELHAARSFAGPPIDAVVPSVPLTTGVFQLHSIVLDGTDLRHWIDGRPATSGTFDDGGEPLHQGGLILAADFTTGNDVECDVAELLAYSTALGELDRSAVEAYLMEKYDL